MAFTFAAFTYICALVIDAFLIFFAIFHVSKTFYSKALFYHNEFPDHCIRRAEDRLQEPYRPMRQPEPPGAPGVHPAHRLQHPIPHGGGVV